MTDAATANPTSTLAGVPETLLITLAARLMANRQNPDLHFTDTAAEEVGNAIGFDPARFSSDKASMRGCVARGQWFDRVVSRFLAAHPDGLVVSIGSGLDTRANRVNLPERADWVDIDFPEVIALREAYVPPLPNAIAIAADGTNVASWAERTGWRDGRPVIVIAEGVSMYLQPSDAEAWLRGLIAQAGIRRSSLTLALDLASPLMVRQSHRHPSVSKTGARFAWGLKRPQDLGKLGVGLRIVETFDIARQCGPLAWLVASAYRMLTLGRPVYSCALFST
ncbi:class I SAM-dependent methyltransferase [Novosphingobium sp.]|uniref:class I SAM-dependent methyltransferase n=1 Tax=Novosphingobium sp. TaxID=1874826 RepID=UPI002FE1721E